MCCCCLLAEAWPCDTGTLFEIYCSIGLHGGVADTFRQTIPTDNRTNTHMEGRADRPAHALIDNIRDDAAGASASASASAPASIMIAR